MMTDKPDILESMARAIYETYCAEVCEDVEYGTEFERANGEIWNVVTRAALTAALDHMREPTEGMVDAGEELDEMAADYSGYSEIPATCEKHWQAMLSQLRKEALGDE